jgi:hypothetical protein
MITGINDFEDLLKLSNEGHSSNAKILILKI